MSRRHILGTGAAAEVAGFAAAAVGTPGSPDEPQQGIGTTRGNPRAAVDPGPQNPAIAEQFPAALSPPATDVGDLPQS